MHCSKVLGIGRHKQTTPDGKFSLEEVEMPGSMLRCARLCR